MLRRLSPSSWWRHISSVGRSSILAISCSKCSGTTCGALAALNTEAPVSRSAERLIASGTQIQHLLDDLLDFSRTQLGVGIPVTPELTNLEPLCANETDQIRGAYPDRSIELATTGDRIGSWHVRACDKSSRTSS